MKDNGNIKKISLVSGIAFAVYVLLYFVIPFDKTSVANWTVFVFTIVSFGFTEVTAYIWGKNEGLKSKVYHIPVLGVAIYYLVAQVVFSVIIYLVTIWFPVPAWISAAVSILALGAAAIGVISNMQYAEVAENVDRETEIRTREYREFKLDVDSVASCASDAEIREKLFKFAEEVRYSDPVSNEKIEGLERDMAVKLEQLKLDISEGRKQDALEGLEHMNGMLKERNAKLKALK